VLVANERQDRLVIVADVIRGLGHEVIAPQIEVSEVGRSRRASSPTLRSSVWERARSMRSS